MKKIFIATLLIALSGNLYAISNGKRCAKHYNKLARKIDKNYQQLDTSLITIQRDKSPEMTSALDHLDDAYSYADYQLENNRYYRVYKRYNCDDHTNLDWNRMMRFKKSLRKLFHATSCGQAYYRAKKKFLAFEKWAPSWISSEDEELMEEFKNRKARALKSARSLLENGSCNYENEYFSKIINTLIERVDNKGYTFYIQSLQESYEEDEEEEDDVLFGLY